jgi:segregation and condensation protein B
VVDKEQAVAEPQLLATASNETDAGQPLLDQAVTPPAAAPGQAQLPMLVESLLFVASEPVPIVRLAQLLGVSQEAIEIALADLSVACKNGGRGIRLQRKGDRVQLTTAPEAAPYVEQFLGLDVTSKLSPAALETLSVIAYKQPLTRADIEAVRGVNCDGVLRTLLSRELIEPVGRLEQPGRPFLYGTTERFLQYLGLESLADLPPLPEE